MLNRTLLLLISLMATVSISCATTENEDDMEAFPTRSYLKYVSFDLAGNERVLLRWQKRQMPLKVYMPEPPAGLFEDPEVVQAAVRRAILDWTDTAGDGIPSFEFVDSSRDANIPIDWAEEADGDWYIAHCSYDIQQMARRFGVNRILITGRLSNGSVAAPQFVHAVMLHEVGHALGLGGHSPIPTDIMYAGVDLGFDAELTSSDKLTIKELYSKPNGKRMVGARSERY